MPSKLLAASCLLLDVLFPLVQLRHIDASFLRPTNPSHPQTSDQSDGRSERTEKSPWQTAYWRWCSWHPLKAQEMRIISRLRHQWKGFFRGIHPLPKTLPTLLNCSLNSARPSFKPRFSTRFPHMARLWISEQLALLLRKVPMTSSCLAYATCSQSTFAASREIAWGGIQKANCLKHVFRLSYDIYLISAILRTLSCRSKPSSQQMTT